MMAQGRQGALSPLAESTRKVEGKTLTLLRHFRGISQRKLAKLTALHHVSISQYERGVRKLDDSAKHRILEALQLPDRSWEDMLEQVEWQEWLSESYQQKAAEGSSKVRREVTLRRGLEQVASDTGRGVTRCMTEFLNLLTERRET